MNVLPELWAHMARLMVRLLAQRTARLLATAATLLVLAACGPGTGGTGTGPILGAVNFSGSGFAIGAPCAEHCGSTELRLENERVELTVACRHFVFTGPWEIDATGLAVLSGTLETTELAEGQVQTRTVAAEMRLQFSDTRAETSREVAITLRDAQGNHLIAPLTLEQRPAATAPEACAPSAP